MNSILFLVAVFITSHQVLGQPDAAYMCILDGDDKLELKFHLLKNGTTIVGIDALDTSHKVIAAEHCRFSGDGNAGSPYALSVNIDRTLSGSYDSTMYCGVDASGAGRPYIYTWLVRARTIAGLNSDTDKIYRLTCNPLISTKGWVSTIGIDAADIQETTLQQTACISQLGVKKNNVATTTLVIGDQITVVVSVICGAQTTLAPTGVYLTDLSVSNDPAFPDDVAIKRGIVGSDGCILAGSPFTPTGECKKVATPDPGVHFQYECGLIKIHTFTQGDQRTLYFKGKVNVCFDPNVAACTLGACGRLTIPNGRRKRAAHDMNNVTKSLEVLVEPYQGAFVPAPSSSSKQGDESCLESTLFIGVFVVIVVMLVMVTALSIFLFTRIGKFRRSEKTVSGKINPAF